MRMAERTLLWTKGSSTATSSGEWVYEVIEALEEDMKAGVDGSGGGGFEDAAGQEDRALGVVFQDCETHVNGAGVYAEAFHGRGWGAWGRRVCIG